MTSDRKIIIAILLAAFSNGQSQAADLINIGNDLPVAGAQEPLTSSPGAQVSPAEPAHPKDPGIPTGDDPVEGKDAPGVKLNEDGRWTGQGTEEAIARILLNNVRDLAREAGDDPNDVATRVANYIDYAEEIESSLDTVDNVRDMLDIELKNVFAAEEAPAERDAGLDIDIDAALRAVRGEREEQQRRPPQRDGDMAGLDIEIDAALRAVRGEREEQQRRPSQRDGDMAGLDIDAALRAVRGEREEQQRRPPQRDGGIEISGP
jgi:hypothetical protein